MRLYITFSDLNIYTDVLNVFPVINGNIVQVEVIAPDLAAVIIALIIPVAVSVINPLVDNMGRIKIGDHDVMYA